VAPFEDAMTLLILGKGQETKQRLLRVLEWKDEVVVPIDHQDGDANA
jgi:hypothetical protein